MDDYSTFTEGGTSLAAPLIAGMVAAAQQGQATPFGFLNPLLYRLAGSTALRDVLPITSTTPNQQRAVFGPETNPLCNQNWLLQFDSQNAAYTDQRTAPGYDTMTGVGTPNGQAFITALRRMSGSNGAQS